MVCIFLIFSSYLILEICCCNGSAAICELERVKCTGKWVKAFFPARNFKCTFRCWFRLCARKKITRAKTKPGTVNSNTESSVACTKADERRETTLAQPKQFIIVPACGNMLRVFFALFSQKKSLLLWMRARLVRFRTHNQMSLHVSVTAKNSSQKRRKIAKLNRWRR